MSDDSDDSMPPLDYVGASRPSVKTPSPVDKDVTKKERDSGSADFAPGDLVTLRGLSKADLNGETGRILPSTGSRDGRLAVKLTRSGQKLSIKSQNLEKGKGFDSEAKAEDSDDSMPPLEYVGTTLTAEEASYLEKAEAKPVATAPKAAQVRELPDGSGDPLRVSQSGANGAVPPASFSPGDRVVLRGLSKLELNGQPAVVLPATSSTETGRLPVRLLKSQQVLSIKRENLERGKEESSDSEDSMPPLEVKGETLKRGKEEPSDSEDSMPPLEIKGEKLKRGKEEPSDSDDSMPPLEMLNQTDCTKSDDSDPLPPLEYIGRHPDSAPTGRGQQQSSIPRAGTQLAKSIPLQSSGSGHSQGSFGQAAPAAAKPPAAARPVAAAPAKAAKEAPSSGSKLKKRGAEDSASDDSMPPLEYVGASLGPQQRGLRESPKAAAAPSAAASAAPSASRSTAPSKAATAASSAVASAAPSGARSTGPSTAPAAPSASPSATPREGAFSSSARAMQSESSASRPSAENRLPAAAPASIPPGSREKEPKGQESRPREGAAEPKVAKDPATALREWCEELRLPTEDLVERLLAEDVQDPADLAFVPEDDLSIFTQGMKIGAKGRFLAAVRSMK